MIRNDRHSKGEILGRMRRSTANILGINHTELLDPTISLLLESLSEEIYKIAGEIESIEDRILEKLSSILVPATNTIAQPAHCILRAVPQDSITEITTEKGFRYFCKERSRSYDFYPVCNTNIHKGEILYFVHSGSIYTINRDLSKTLYIRSQRHGMDGNTFWLGLDLDENIANISGLSFYFDLYAVYNKEEYLNLLSYTAWSIGKDRLVMNKGISSQKEMPEDMALRLFSRYSLTNKINQSVTDRYNDHFLTIAEDCPVSDKKEYFPAELAPDFSENIKEKTGKPLIWIKITCPHRISPDIIDSLLLSINAFPVLNKEFISKITEVNKAIPIIPVNTECNQSFLSVHNINDSSGTKYYDVPVNGGTAHGFGVYAMRRGGIERYRKQDGDEYLTKITDSLRNKVSSFFKNRNDVKGDLRKIEYQVIRLINNLKRQQFQSREWSEVVNYLLIDPPKENDIYFTDYWVTNGNDANNIKAGSMFACISGLPVHPASVYSLSATKGGAYAPLGERKQNLYKNSLAQHDLLVTNEDIADFCLREFKESINKVEVSRGFMKSSDPKPGFVETTDVYLTPVKNMEEFVREKDREYFHRSLKEHSPATFNYRVFIKNALSTQETISI